MSESASRTSGSQVLRPRARLIRTLGDELISSEIVAISELVKNSYDADATRVMIRFCPPLEPGAGSIEILDNGHGMSLETIRTVWLEPANPLRKREQRSELFRRRVLGEKGIGRFASARLARFLEIVTRRTGSASEVKALFDWSLFENDDKYLDEIEILWEETDSTEILPGGTMRFLWPEGCSADDDQTHGTILRMEGVRSSWGQEQFVALRTSLSRLISPFEGSDDEAPFRIFLHLPEEFQGLAGAVEPSEILSNPHYVIRGIIDKDGGYDLEIEGSNLKVARQTRSGRFRVPSSPNGNTESRAPECGPFWLELRVWDRDTPSLRELANQYHSSVTDVRRDLNAAAGINIYRDRFRVLPYGEPRNDWLRLDLRRVQNPTTHLSNNQIVGYVLITSDENPELRDQSNREGLMETRAFSDLQCLLKQVLVYIETIRYDVRREEQNTEKPTGLMFGMELTDISDYVRREYPNDTTLDMMITQRSSDIEVNVSKIAQMLSRYRNLSTLGQLIDAVLHDGRTPLTKIGNESIIGLRNSRRITDPNNKKQVEKHFNAIIAYKDILASLFARIEPFGGRKRPRPSSQSLEDLIRNAFSILESDIRELHVDIQIPDTNTLLIVDQSEIQLIFINLLQNSLYWLHNVPIDQREISISIRNIPEERVEVIFSDSGPGVPQDIRDLIFDPYFSTKPDGIGLGLSIVGETLAEYYSGTLELIDSDLLPGASFRIRMGRRN
jgi:signal transduction histidine kinase